MARTDGSANDRATAMASSVKVGPAMPDFGCPAQPDLRVQIHPAPSFTSSFSANCLPAGEILTSPSASTTSSLRSPSDCTASPDSAWEYPSVSPTPRQRKQSPAPAARFPSTRKRCDALSPMCLHLFWQATQFETDTFGSVITRPVAPLVTFKNRLFLMVWVVTRFPLMPGLSYLAELA